MKMLRNFLAIIPLLGTCVVADAQAEETPANFVWCDCICGNYNPLDFMCVVSVPNQHVSRYLSKLAPLSLRAGASLSFRPAGENPALCEPADVFPWKPDVSQMPFKGFVAVKLQASHPYGPIPVGTPITLRG